MDLITYIESKVELSAQAVVDIRAACSQKQYAAGAQILPSEAIHEELRFIERGMIRLYRIINGKDISFFFYRENDFASDYESFLLTEPSPLYMEAIQPTSVRILKRSDIHQLYQQYHPFESLGRLMAEQAYLSATRRLKYHQVASLKDRYLFIKAEMPWILESVPQYHVASYLGVQPQSLSRIKAEIEG